jgi:hypothetical protein
MYKQPPTCHAAPYARQDLRVIQPPRRHGHYTESERTMLEINKFSNITLYILPAFFIVFCRLLKLHPQNQSFVLSRGGSKPPSAISTTRVVDARRFGTSDCVNQPAHFYDPSSFSFSGVPPRLFVSSCPSTPVPRTLVPRSLGGWEVATSW